MYTWSELVNITHDALLWTRQAGGAREFGQLIDACAGPGRGAAVRSAARRGGRGATCAHASQGTANALHNMHFKVILTPHPLEVCRHLGFRMFTSRKTSTRHGCVTVRAFVSTS